MGDKLLRLVWSPAAKEDLTKIWRYFARVASPEIADSLLREIDYASERLRGNPLQWRLRMDIMPGLKGGLRSVLVHPYTIFYQLADDDVRIVRVLHERRNFGPILSEKHRRLN
jgi:toxin ParE1/3/4